MLSDLNLVCCALATVSAAVGYRYSRRCAERGAGAARLFTIPLSRKFLFKRRDSRASEASMDTQMSSENDSLSDCPTPSDAHDADVTEPGTLKRKTREDDVDNYPDASCATASSPPRRTSSPPRKRCRTPSPGEPQDNVTESPAVGREEPGADRAGPPLGASLAATAPQHAGVEHAHASDVHTDAQAQAPSASAIECGAQGSPPDAPVTPSNPIAPIPATAAAVPSTLPSSFAIPVCKPSSAFSAFVGTSSGFGATAAAADGSQRPVWCSGPLAGNSKSESTPETAETTEDNQPTNSGEPGQGSALALTPVRNAFATSGSADAPEALAASVRATSAYVGSTGEEEEDVLSDLKGVKMFVKRGTRDFSGGMLGHIKLLSHKDSREERLVFRREPVWKVSMSVRLRPAVRCVFDEEHGILRLTLKEPVECVRGGKATPETRHDVVVYALTKGKASRADFAQFASAVAASTRLKEQLPTQIALS